MRTYVWTKGSVPPEERIKARIDTSDPLACWLWPGASRADYGCIMTGSRSDGTRMTRDCHVVMWEAEYGPTPDGHELHHLCLVKLCCNPRHLAPVTHQENCTLVPESVKKARRDRLAQYYAREM